jgi:hypothetical protein
MSRWHACGSKMRAANRPARRHFRAHHRASVRKVSQAGTYIHEVKIAYAQMAYIGNSGCAKFA